jgi:uncharacterized radical SAM superfamily Fe-S cluster-containing enzyme
MSASAKPPVRKAADQIYYTFTKGLCKTCKAPVDAKIVFRGDAVWFDKFCPEHGHQDALVASSVEWYLDALSFIAPNTPPTKTKPVSKGCPLDCGPCASHQQRNYLPVIPITSQCNLDCPICYTVNKNEGAHQMTDEEMNRIIENLLSDHREIDIINFTGGEPTLHPRLLDFLQMCRDAGIKRATISTNGLKLRNEEYVRKLAALDARIVLSLDTFDPAVDKIMLGADTLAAKLAALELLQKHDVTTTILPAIAAGLNDKDLPRLFELMLSKPNICSLELHTLTFTGQGGVGFDRSARITIPDLHRGIENASGGRLTAKDFVPSPLAHAHCYSISYLLMLDGGGYVPFTRLFGRAKLYELLQDSLYIEPREKLERTFSELIDKLWADPDSLPEAKAVGATLKRLLVEMFPQGRPALDLRARQRIAERSVKAVYIHSHMDEETFDVTRIMKCCVGVPSTDGGNIPTCAYNVLYREKDPRFADARMLERMSRARANAPKETR